MSQPSSRLLPLAGLQGAIATFGGFLAYFIVRGGDVHALFGFTAAILSAATGASVLACALGPRLRLGGRQLGRLGFMLPGLAMVAGGASDMVLALSYGSFVGLTWSARHLLEMSVLSDHERDAYAARSNALSVASAIAATALAALLLAKTGDDLRTLASLYGVLCIAGGLSFGRLLPDTAPVAIVDPLGVVRQKRFAACLPLLFLESGLCGVTQAVDAAGAAMALHSASGFGWAATVAGLAGGAALFATRRARAVDNRARWLGGACAAMAAAFLLLGASAWLPGLYLAAIVLRSAAAPFLTASEQVLNQRTLDMHGTLPDRILAREVVLWSLRMLSLGGFWLAAQHMSPQQVLVAGALLMATAALLEFATGRMLLRRDGREARAM